MSQREHHSPASVDADEGSGQTQPVIRACDACHRMKMKCVGKKEPPCNRCRHAGQPCTFDGPRKGKTSRLEGRMSMVETRMEKMQGAIEELLRLQRTAIPDADAAGRIRGSEDGGDSCLTSGVVTTSPLGGHTQTIHGSQTVLSFHSLTDHSTPDHRLSSPLGPLISQSWSTIPGPRPVVPPASDLARRLPDTRAAETQDKTVIALNPANEGENDPIELDSSSLGPWDSMFNDAEAARLRQDEHLGTARPSGASHAQSAGSGGEKKPKRPSTTMDDLPEFEYQSAMTRQIPKMRGNQSRRFEDPVDLGWCTAERGKELYNSFMSHCLVFMPCFDPAFDTFESMRSRSPFCVTTLIYVASKLEDPASTPSDLQKLCQEHAEKIGMSTLFNPISTLEAVQAMVALSSWGDTSWRPGGHAVRMAMDMGLYRCLPSLVQTGMGRGKSSEELKEDRSLVTGARCWLTLCKMEFEMAFNLGRPALFGGEESIRLARDFLKHPLSIINDSRLVASCELLAKRLVLHQPFAFVPHTLVGNDIVQTLRESEVAAMEWYNYWDAYYERLGVGKGHILRESLITQRAGAVMYLNSKILHGVRSQKDMASLSKAQLDRLVVAIRASETLIGMGLRSQDYASMFRYANSFSHIGMGYTARFIIRMASLMPSEINLRQVARDVETLANVLTQVPGFQFAHVLLDALKRARRDKVLPPPTQPPSPTGGTHDPLEQYPLPASSAARNFDPVYGLPPFDYGVDTGGAGQVFDFSFADQLLGNLDATTEALTGRPSHSDASYIDFNLASQSSLNGDDWFPFGPLDPETTSRTFPASESINISNTAPGTGTGGAGSEILNGQWW